MAVKVEIFYEAKCKDCTHSETLKRKTTCKLKSLAIRQNDKACDQFKL